MEINIKNTLVKVNIEETKPLRVIIYDYYGVDSKKLFDLIKDANNITDISFVSGEIEIPNPEHWDESNADKDHVIMKN